MSSSQSNMNETNDEVPESVSSPSHTAHRFIPEQASVSLGATESQNTVHRDNTESQKRSYGVLNELFEVTDAPAMSSASDSHRPPQPPTATLPLQRPTDSTTLQPSVRVGPPKPPHLHHRTVSWGKVVNMPFEPSHVHPSPNIQQPTLGRASSAHTAHTAYSLSSGYSGHHRRLDTLPGGRLQLEDVTRTTPFEEEAETHILKALEHQTYGRPRSDTATSTILSGVPDHAVHDFSMDSPVPNASRTDEYDTDCEAAMERSYVSRGDSHKSQTRPLILSSAVPKNIAHRRTKSVEATLYDLTAAMSAVHDKVEYTAHHADLDYRDELPLSPSAGDPNVMLGTNPTDNGEAIPERWNFFKQISRPGRKYSESNADHVEDQPMDDEDDDDDEEHSAAAARQNSRKNQEIPHGRYEFHVDNGALSDSFQLHNSSHYVEIGHGTEEQNTKHDSAPGRKPALPRPSRRSTVLAAANHTIKEKFEFWGAFFHPRKDAAMRYLKTITLYLMLPSIGISAILFYLCNNPHTGTYENGNETGSRASISWWFLFVGVRLVITFTLALATQAWVIDFLALGTRILLHVVGPVFTLLIVQSKGWPFIACTWSIYNFAMLHGNGPFAAHWGFWQDTIDMFNDQNPSGNIVSNEWNTRILSSAIAVGAVVAVKRFGIGLYLGRQTYAHFGQQLAKVMNKMLLVSEVAGFAKEMERSAVFQDVTLPVPSEAFGYSRDSLHGLAISTEEDEDAEGSVSMRSRRSVFGDRIFDANARDPLTGSLHASEQMKLFQLLERWEEPDRDFDRVQNEQATISAVLNFRKALTFIQKRYPFSFAFGDASTRENCIESAQNLYQRLLKRTPGEDVLPFETIALLAVDADGSIDQGKAKDLVRVFRPDRQGKLSLLDFVKSVDSVYKSYRLLNAAIENSSQLDRAFENMFNILFYAILSTVLLSLLGFNPLALFLSLSSVVLAISFAIGSASAKAFEGMLFILIRRPYSIGDRIHVSGVEDNTSLEGSPCWIVQNVTLFETTAIWGPTNEHCSLSNGSLANSRIINAARSPQCQFHIFLKFPMNTPYEKILIFKSAVEEYMKARPREWLSLNGFRANRVEADRGYVEYDIVIQHREAWQEVGQILDSKANLCSYCQEVTKQLDMHYSAPPLPVDLRLNGPLPTIEHQGFSEDLPPEVHTSSLHDEVDSEARARQFRDIAMTRHNIKLN